MTSNGPGSINSNTGGNSDTSNNLGGHNNKNHSVNDPSNTMNGTTNLDLKPLRSMRGHEYLGVTTF